MVMASLGGKLPFEALQYENVPIKCLVFSGPPVNEKDAEYEEDAGYEEDDGYEELMETLEESAPWKSLCEAIERGDEDMFREESSNCNGLSTLPAKRQAILAKRPDFLRQLLEKDNSIEDDTVATACEKRDRESVRILLEFGWPIDRPLNSAASLLCTAVDDAEFMQWLIESGADANVRSKLGESVLSVAIAHGSIDVVRLLLARGVDVEHGDLLHCAAERRNQFEGVELVEELVNRGADVNAHCHNNDVAFRLRGMSTLLTPLHIACREENVLVAKSLLQYGADQHRMTLNAGKLANPTPLDMALKSENQSLIKLLNKARSVQENMG